jgi:ABC-2 type transport system permease protein
VAALPLPALQRYVAKTLTITDLEVRKLGHDPTELFTRAVQPALWLLIFGEVLTRTHAIPTGGLPYLDFMAPGILAQSVLFVAIFYGIAIIWERDRGITHKFLASPTSRTALVLGKALSAGVRAIVQAAIVYLLALVLGVHLNWQPLALLGMLLFVILGAACFSTFSLIIACLAKTRERFMGIGQLLTMPLFFASNAIYPLVIMPPWLQVLALVNPLTYEVDGLRALMLPTGWSVGGLGLDAAVLVGVTSVLVVIGGPTLSSCGHLVVTHGVVRTGPELQQRRLREGRHAQPKWGREDPWEANVMGCRRAPSISQRGAACRKDASGPSTSRSPCGRTGLPCCY